MRRVFDCSYNGIQLEFQKTGKEGSVRISYKMHGFLTMDDAFAEVPEVGIY